MSDSDKSLSQSSNGSVAELKRCVEELLIDSDEEEKNTRKLAKIKNEFAVFKKITPQMSSYDKLQLFIRDAHFKNKVHQKFTEKKIPPMGGVPILKAYLVATRFKAQIEEQFEESDVVNVFQKFGHIQQISVIDSCAYVQYQHLVSAYLATKILNDFVIGEKLRLVVRLCTENESLQAQSFFYSRSRRLASQLYPGEATSTDQATSGVPHTKYIAKFELAVESLPEFNISQRIIGPKGSYMKRIIEKVLSSNPLAHNYNLANVNTVFKMRLLGGPGCVEPGHDSEPLHLFISTKQRWMFQSACLQVECLMTKLFQDYKIAYQKLYRKYVSGTAYKILQYEGSYYNEIKRVTMEEIEEALDILSLAHEGKLPEKVIEEKIQQRQQARKKGKFDQADEIRDWLKSKGVQIVDPKVKRGKTTWSYIKI